MNGQVPSKFLPRLDKYWIKYWVQFLLLICFRFVPEEDDLPKKLCKRKHKKTRALPKSSIDRDWAKFWYGSKIPVSEKVLNQFLLFLKCVKIKQFRLEIHSRTPVEKKNRRSTLPSSAVYFKLCWLQISSLRFFFIISKPKTMKINYISIYKLTANKAAHKWDSVLRIASESALIDEVLLQNLYNFSYFAKFALKFNILIRTHSRFIRIIWIPVSIFFWSDLSWERGGTSYILK